MGDFGTGKREQYQLGEQMARVRAQFPFTLMLTVGDNLYGGNGPKDFLNKFEKPYKALLDGGVKFYASLGNHDSRASRATTSRSTWAAAPTTRSRRRSRACDSSRSSRRISTRSSCSGWNASSTIRATTGRSPISTTRSTRPAGGTARICPSGKRWSRCSSSTASAWSSPDTTTSTSASSRSTASSTSWSARAVSCARGTSTRTPASPTAANATEQAFLAVEIDGDEMYFNAVSRTGKVIDSGVIARRKRD